MSKVYADTVEASEPDKNLTLGATGDSVTVGGTSINANIVQDSGGNILWQSDGAGTLSNVNTGLKNNLHLISTQTANRNASIDFTSGIDSTYDTYCVQIIGVCGVSDGVYMQFAATKDGGSSWGTAITASFWATSKAESGQANAPSYQSDRDTVNTTPCKISSEQGGDTDEAGAITMYLFSPASTAERATTFYSESSIYQSSSYAQQDFVAGYINTSDVVNGIKFYYTSGNVKRGTFKLYGLL